MICCFFVLIQILFFMNSLSHKKSNTATLGANYNNRFRKKEESDSLQLDINAKS